MRLKETQFAAWLKAKRLDEIVGANRDSCGCPIARFYYEASGGSEIVIFQGDWGYVIDRGYSKRPLPAWASDFVSEVDSDGDGRITARRALEALAS